MKTIQLVKSASEGAFSTHLAICSFAVGTLLLFTHFLLPDDFLVYYIGYLFVTTAFLVNLFTFFYLAYQFVANRLERQIIAIRILILLSNIPITILYLYIVFHQSFN